MKTASNRIIGLLFQQQKVFKYLQQKKKKKTKPKKLLETSPNCNRKKQNKQKKPYWNKTEKPTVIDNAFKPEWKIQVKKENSNLILSYVML